MSALLKSLAAAGTNPINLKDKVLILPFGARILGLYPASDLNVFYVQPELMAPESARELLKSTAWLPLGGDRTWVSPELDTLGDFQNSPETYLVPKVLDPGNYRVIKSDESSAVLETHVEMLFRRAKATVKFALAKRIKLIPPPALPKGISFAGYDLSVTLKPLAPLPAGVTPAVWELLQTPTGGTIVIPVGPKANPRTLINKPIFTLEKDRVLCTVPAKECYKFAIRAEDCRGMAAYINTTGPMANLMVRTFDVFETDRYRDVTSADPTGYGNVQEIYVDDGRFGSFGEMEHQSPCLGLDDSEEVTDHSVTMAFAGPEKALRTLLEDLIRKQIGG